MTTRTSFLAALLGALMGLPACVSNHCTDHGLNQYSCDGNHVVGCYMDDTGGISTEFDCGSGFCRNPRSGVAFCAARPDPDPACPDNIDQLCNANGDVVDCNFGGYVTQVVASCGSRDLCISGVGSDGPFCALGNEPDPRCPPASNSLIVPHCGDGGHLLSCRIGYLVSDKACGDPSLCYTPPGPREDVFQDPTCIVSAAVDPTCAAISAPAIGDPRHKTGCEGNQAIDCVDDHLTEIHDCGAKGCTAKDDVGACNL